jgi:hypothetical protein
MNIGKFQRPDNAVLYMRNGLVDAVARIILLKRISHKSNQVVMYASFQIVKE